MNKITFESDFTIGSLRETVASINVIIASLEEDEGSLIITDSEQTAEEIADSMKPNPAPGDEDQTEETTSVDLDSDGLPHDVRIHSANKTKLAKGGGWKKKRGVDDALVTSVEAELRATMAATGEPHVIDDLIEETKAPAPPATEEVIAPAPPAAVVPMEDTDYQCTDGSIHKGSVLLASGWTKEQVEGLTALTPPSEAPAAPVTAVTFPELMTLITPALAAKTIAESDVLKAVNDAGLTSLALLAARPDLVGQVKTALFG